MRIRRCGALLLEPRETCRFDLADLVSGGTGILRSQRWVALAPHIAEEVVVDATQLRLLGEIGDDQWQELDALARADRPALDALLDCGLLVAEHDVDAASWGARDARQRALNWHL